jgi:hypothetical protein
MRGLLYLALGLLGFALNFWLDSRIGSGPDWGPWYQVVLYMVCGGFIGHGLAQIVLGRRTKKLRRDNKLLKKRLDQESLKLDRMLDVMADLPQDQLREVLENHIAHVIADLKEEGLIDQHDLDLVFEEQARRARSAELN